MTPKIKILCLVVGAVAVLGIAAPSTASATEFHVNTPQKAALKGEQTTKLNSTLTPGPSITCNQAIFEGTAQGGSPQITYQEFTLMPTVTGCSALGLNATLKFNGCKFTATNTTPTSSKTSVVDLVGCTSGKQVETTFPGCTVTTPEQTNISHAVGSNVGTHIEIQLTLQGITFEFHGAACGAAETILTHTGDLTGKITMKAFNDIGSELTTHNGHQYTRPILGAQVALSGT